jgi:drug/metabolite transporter (DMT)-like permease
VTIVERAMPALFVLIWATGFIVARGVAPHAEPLTFLLMRYGLTALVFTTAAFAAGAAWPKGAAGWRDALVAGILIQGVYLGGVFWAARHGIPAGISALISGLQPLLTALLSFPLLGERVRPLQWAGIALGFAGAVLVLLPKLGVTNESIPPLPVLMCFVAVLGITLGTIWQKRTAAKVDLRTNAAVQFIGALLVTVPIAALTEEGRFDGSVQAWAGLIWSVLGLSVGAISLLLILIRRGAVAGVASLFYLVPPVVAVMAYALFGERLLPVQMIGMALAAVGVALANRASAPGR